MPPPLTAELPLSVQLVIVALLFPIFISPPPLPVETLPLKTQLVRLGSPPWLSIAPPTPAMLPMNLQLIKDGASAA